MNWPAFTWDPTLRRYRDGKGRLVAQRQVRQALDEAIDRARQEIKADALLLQNGAINVPEWTLRLEKTVKAVHSLSAAAAAGGWGQMTAGDWGFVGARVKKQYRYLDRFARQVGSGAQALDGRFVQRALMYASAGAGTYEGLKRKRDLAAGGYVLERRLMHSLHPCKACRAYAALGWRQAGTLPDIGEECECLSNCRCTFERKAEARPAAAKPARKHGSVPAAGPPKVAARPLEFDSPAAMDAWGEAAYREWAAGLTPAEGEALMEYTASAFDRFNQALRAGKADQWLGPADRRNVADLAAALSRAKLPEPVVVYRGVRGLDRIGLKAADLTPGLELPPDRGFGSLSLERGRAEVFAGGGLRGGVLLKITLPAGAPGAYVNAAGEYSAKKGEKEFLLPPGTLKLRVTAVTRRQDGRHVAEAEWVP